LEESLRAAGVFVMHHPDNFFMWRVIAPDKLARRLGVTAAEESGDGAVRDDFEEPNALYWTADRF
jgi:hypothetical protein